MNQLLELIAGLANVEHLDIDHLPRREGDVRRTEADVSLARELIGYEPGVPIEEGLRRAVNWFRAHAEITGPISASPAAGSKGGAAT